MKVGVVERSYDCGLEHSLKFDGDNAGFLKLKGVTPELFSKQIVDRERLELLEFIYIYIGKLQYVQSKSRGLSHLAIPIGFSFPINRYNL